MNLGEAIDILRHHNKWRRGADIPMKDPKEIGEAIDLITEHLEKAHAPL